MLQLYTSRNVLFAGKDGRKHFCRSHSFVFGVVLLEQMKVLH
jgi:hypothetical protein